MVGDAHPTKIALLQLVQDAIKQTYKINLTLLLLLVQRNFTEVSPNLRFAAKLSECTVVDS